MRMGESVQIAVPPDSLDFLLQAKSLRVTINGDMPGAPTALVAGPNRARDRVLLAAPRGLSPASIPPPCQPSARRASSASLL